MSGREVPAISELRRRGPLVSVVPGLRSPLPDAVRKSAGVDRLVRAVAVVGDAYTKGLRFEFASFSCGRAQGPPDGDVPTLALEGGLGRVGRARRPRATTARLAAVGRLTRAPWPRK